MAEDLLLVIKRKIVQLAKYKNELIDKLELIIEKHDEMVPHINSAHLMATQAGRNPNPRLQTIESMARYDSGNKDFTMELFKGWEKDISEIRKELGQLTFTLSTLREIRDSQKTKTKKK